MLKMDRLPTTCGCDPSSKDIHMKLASSRGTVPTHKTPLCLQTIELPPAVAKYRRLQTATTYLPRCCVTLRPPCAPTAPMWTLSTDEKCISILFVENCAGAPGGRPRDEEGDVSAVRAVHHAVRARCIHFPRARTTFSFPLCCFLHLTTICPSLVVSPCAVAAG